MVERYLQAVRYWLPVSGRDDLVAELAEDIRSQVEEREREAGRPLDERELRGLLQRHGHPLWVASRYLPQQWLIGPGVLPIYRQVLRWSLACVGAIFVVLAIMSAFAPGSAANATLRTPGFWIWHGVVWAFAYTGLLTFLFAWIERRQRAVTATDRWDPALAFELPASPERQEAARATRVRVGAIGSLAGGSLFLAFWLGVWRMEAPAELPLRLAPVWHTIAWPVVVLAVGSMALAVASIVRPRPSRLRTGLAFARDLLGLAVIATLFAAGRLIEVSVPGGPADRVAVLDRWANVSLLVTPAVVGLAFLAEAVVEARALARKPAGGDPRPGILAGG